MEAVANRPLVIVTKKDNAPDVPQLCRALQGAFAWLSSLKSRDQSIAAAEPPAPAEEDDGDQNDQANCAAAQQVRQVGGGLCHRRSGRGQRCNKSELLHFRISTSAWADFVTAAPTETPETQPLAVLSAWC